MCFVDDDQIDRTQLARPLVDGLNASNRDGVLEVASLQAGGVDAHRQVRRNGPELLSSLFEQLLDVRKDEHAAAPRLHGIAADCGHDRGLAACGWDDDARVVITLTQVVVDRINGLALIGTKVHQLSTSEICTMTLPPGTTAARSIESRSIWLSSL